MRFKSISKAFVALCMAAIILIAACGCEDLGAYENTEEYYSSFGDIVLIDGTTKNKTEYSVETYFYNKESREDFLKGEDGAYKGVEYAEYVYMAIPFESSIDMDTLALFIQSKADVTVYISVFISDKIPTNWKAVADNVINQDGSNIVLAEGAENESQNTEKVYDDPDSETRIGEVSVHLKNGKWNSFVLDVFKIGGKTQNSIQINDGQYILLQIRNNSGVRVFNEGKQAYVDAITGIELPSAEITMTNLLIRALDVKNGDEAQGGN
ncbi:MAG: hypothetical protein II297_01710 [Clostridia bacterium]|nr:hypothetical protein [Clostridia bacterium]